MKVMTKLQKLRAKVDKCLSKEEPILKRLSEAEKATTAAELALFKEEERISREAEKADKLKREAQHMKTQADKHAIRMKTPWYKWVTANGCGIYQSDYQYNLPTPDGRPGKQHNIKSMPVACQSGFHAVKAAHVKTYQHKAGPIGRLFEVVVGGKYDHRENDKSTFQKMTFVREVVMDSEEWNKLTRIRL